MWGSSFVGCHPGIRPSFPPSSSPPPPLTHFARSTHSLHSLTPLTHSLHSLTHSTHSLTPLTHSTHSLRFSPEEGAAARVVAAGGPALSAVSRDCRRGCGARGRRWGPGSLRSVRRSVQRLQKGLRRAWSPLGARLSPQCPAQCPETAEGAAARVVAAGGLCGSVRYCHCDLQSNGCDRLRIAL